VWAGMMNESFGFINQVLLGGASVPWLTDPWMAKLSVLIVNLWLGFPYMFLVCMGALQGIPEDVNEAAVMDGANPWQIFRRIKLPLLLVTVAPLLISSFAFNFNNFNLIYMLTGGGPRFSDVSIPVGHTDILISMVYKVAFVGANRDYGLASAFAIIIFVLVALISYLSFRQTKVLEELN
jgi:arabinogalactan oligomer/maltooligosaccharide transport system permease protein